MLHVEVIQNEWAAGQQRVVARLVLNGTGALEVESDDLPTWRPITMRPFFDGTAGREISPDADAEAFITLLHNHLRGDYLFATEAHAEGVYEHAVGAVIPIVSAAAPQESV